MKIEDFISALEEEFDDVETGLLKAASVFREPLEWNSINALIFIALCDIEYDVTMTAADIDAAITVQNLYDTIVSKMNK